MSITSFIVLSVFILNMVSLGVTLKFFMLNLVMLFVTSAFYQSIYFKCGYYGCFILDWHPGYCYAESHCTTNCGLTFGQLKQSSVLVNISWVR